VYDNGEGFDPEEAKAGNSFGLIGMRERALQFNGELYVLTEKGNGTLIQLKIPIFGSTKLPI